MRAPFRFLLLFVLFAFSFSILAVPSVDVKAAREITITITEAQLAKYLRTVKPRDAKSLDVDIIEGGIVVKIYTKWVDISEYHENFGVLIREGKIVTEFGVMDFPGLGALGYEDIKNLIPEVLPFLDHDASVLSKYVLRQVTAKAGRRYTPVSVVTGSDKIVIVVSK
jgi:hypothetical protein